VKYLVDANVLSETTKPSPHGRVVEWLHQNESELVVSTIVLGELEFGILKLPAGRRRARLERWFKTVIGQLRVLDFDAASASEWARLVAGLRVKGRAMPVTDSLIAATALAHGLIVATRNTHDFRSAGAKVVNPFDF